MSHLPENRELTSLDAPPSPSCCGLRQLTTTTLAVAATVAIGAACYFAGRSSQLEQNLQLTSQQWASQLPLIDASAAVASDKFSIATGSVSDDAEGLFVLDHNSGLLQCNVIYPRVGRFMASFSVNVSQATGTGGKGAKYIMVTGGADFRQSSPTNPAAPQVVYVMDTTTGNYACYGIPFDRTMLPRNQPQQGALVLIATGSANPLIDRDKLR